MLRSLALPGLALLAGTVPGYALEVVKTLDVAAPPAKIWTTAGDFCGIGTWHPAIEKCAPSSKDGKSLRTPSLKGGGNAGLAAAILLLAGAYSSNAPPPAAPQAAASAPLPQGGGWGPAIARTQAVVDSDVATGNLNKPVGDRFGADPSGAAEACSAGREREALGLLAGAKARYGYP